MHFLLLIATPLVADTTCNSTSLSGGFAFKFSGTNTRHNILFAIVGRFEADGEGSLRGNATRAAQGNISRAAFTGTYTVKPDCTGEALLTFPDNMTTKLDFVMSDDMGQLFMIDADTGVVETGVAVRQFSKEKRSTSDVSRTSRKTSGNRP